MAVVSGGTTLINNGALDSGVSTGALILIKSITVSGSASVSFVDGTDGVVLDDTYKEYVFTFNNMHPATNQAIFSVNMSVDGGSNYNVAKQTTNIEQYHAENGSASGIGYVDTKDLANGTGILNLSSATGSGNDESCSGSLHLFNPSSTTFATHFISDVQGSYGATYSINHKVAGYCNSTDAINAVQFTFSSGNIDAGDICLYGIV